MQTDNRVSIVVESDLEAPKRKTFDHALVALIATGDRRAFELLFTRHNERVYRFVARLTKNMSLAEDVVAEAFLSVWRTAHRFRSECQVSTWLLSIARHRAFSEMRRRSEAPISEDEACGVVDVGNDPEAATSRTTRSAIVRKCLSQLPLAQSEIVDLIYYQEKSISEVAQILEIPEGTVKTRMFYARTRLAGLLKAAGVYHSEG
jgi:RNA polymerase sigma-70 factor (ECF subfamily)